MELLTCAILAAIHIQLHFGGKGDANIIHVTDHFVQNDAKDSNQPLQCFQVDWHNLSKN
jgi:hypothetical protein